MTYVPTKNPTLMTSFQRGDRDGPGDQSSQKTWGYTLVNIADWKMDPDGVDVFPIENGDIPAIAMLVYQ